MSPARMVPEPTRPATESPAPPVIVPRLRAGTPILVRPGNRVHVGIDPTDSLTIALGPSTSAHAVADLLRLLEHPCPAERLVRRATTAGLTPDELRTILDALVSAGRATPPSSHAAPTPTRPSIPLRDFRIQIHGQGPLADALMASMSVPGVSVDRTMRRHADGSLDTVDTGLVVLSDFLVHDPRVVFALTRARIPHLLVRIRDDAGIIGPLVLPGLTSCLMCADHHRADTDPEWPLLAVQLIRRTGYAEPGLVRTTAAITLGQIERLVTMLRAGGPRAVPHGPARSEPQLMNRVLEFRDDPAQLMLRTWLPHPACDCRTWADGMAGDDVVTAATRPHEIIADRRGSSNL